MANPATARKRARGVPNPQHTELLDLLYGRFELPSENNTALATVTKLFEELQREYLALTDKLENRHDPTITAAIRAIHAAEMLAKAAISVPADPAKH